MSEETNTPPEKDTAKGPKASKKATGTKSTATAGAAKSAAKAKASAKKSATKKTAAKKPAVKKPAAKKPAAKKPAAKQAGAKTAPKNEAEHKAEDISDKKAKLEEELAGGEKKSNASEDSKYQPERDWTTGLPERDWGHLVFRSAMLLVFSMLGWLALWAAIGLSWINLIIRLILNEDNPLLQNWIKILGLYQTEVMDYMADETSELPFPISKDFPKNKDK